MSGRLIANSKFGGMCHSRSDNLISRVLRMCRAHKLENYASSVLFPICVYK
jgi:hypothetical protein